MALPGETATRRRTTLLGALLAGWGVVLGVVVLWQPWASCAGEDSSAGCPVSADAVPFMYAALVAALVSAVAGAVVLAAGRARR